MSIYLHICNFIQVCCCCCCCVLAYLTTVFLNRLRPRKRLTSTKSTYFRQLLTNVLIESAEGKMTLLAGVQVCKFAQMYTFTYLSNICSICKSFIFPFIKPRTHGQIRIRKYIACIQTLILLTVCKIFFAQHTHYQRCPKKTHE